MKYGFGGCTVLMLGLAACGGNTGTTVVKNDPATIKSAPAGVATLDFLDLEGSVRPDALPTALPSQQGATLASHANASLSGCISTATHLNVTTFTFNGCVGANGGTLSGTVVATATLSGSSLVFTEVFNLTSALDATHAWQYTGTQTVAVTGSTATVTASPQTAIQAVYTDTTTPANNKTYTFMPNLTVDWSQAGRFLLEGNYAFSQSSGLSIAGAIPAATPLTWTNGCGYPASGTLNLTLTNGPTGTATASAVFGPACGAVVLDGANLTVGSN